MRGMALGQRGGAGKRGRTLGRCALGGPSVCGWSRPRREGAREQARLGRVLGMEGELGPGRRFGLGLGFWVFFSFLFLIQT